MSEKKKSDKSKGERVVMSGYDLGNFWDNDADYIVEVQRD